MKRATLVSRVRKEYPKSIEKKTLVDAVDGLLIDLVCYDIILELQKIADSQSVDGLLPKGRLYDEFFVSLAILEDAHERAQKAKKH